MKKNILRIICCSVWVGLAVYWLPYLFRQTGEAQGWVALGYGIGFIGYILVLIFGIVGLVISTVSFIKASK